MQKQNVQDIKATNNTFVKHAKYITVMQAKAQNEKNAHLFTEEQHKEAAAVALKAKEYYFTKKVHINNRETFIAVKIANTTLVSLPLYAIAKQHNAKIVITKDATILRLFIKK